MLEPAFGLAEGRSLEKHPPGALGPPKRSRPDRLEARGDRFGLPPSRRGRGKKPGPTPPIEGKPAPSTTSWSRAAGLPWRPSSPPPTDTTSPKSCPWSIRSLRSGAKSGTPVGVPSVSTETGPTTPNPIAKRCAAGASAPTWPSDARSTGAAWGATVGWSNGPLPGFTRTAGFAFASSAFRAFTKPSSRSVAPSFAGTFWEAHRFRGCR